MDLLQQNLMYLHQHKNDIFKKIEHYLNHAGNEKKCKLVWENETFPNLSYALDDGIKLLYDVNATDIKDWLTEYQNLNQGEYDVHMYGLGLTHHLSELMKINDQFHFYIYEPELDIFIEMLKVVNIDQLLEHPQIKLLQVGKVEEDIDQFIYMKNLYSLRPTINVFIPFYTSIDKKTMNKYYDKEYRVFTANILALGFEKSFGTLPYRNSIRNIEHLYHSHSLKPFDNKFDGCAALIVGGGPSLELDIETIKKANDRLLIIAAGSSVQTLLHFGIEPHLLVSMDPSEANGRVFKVIDTTEVPLVFVNQIYSPILEDHPKNNFHAYFANDCIINYCFGDLDLKPKIRPNPSVSGSAVQLAYYLGAKKILFAGQDLSFPNNKYYSAGATHQSKDKLNSAMTSNTIKVENVQGQFNNTNPSLKVMLEDIEELIEQMEGITFINTSSLGVKIKGADYVPLTTALQSIENNQYDFSEIKRYAEQETAINEFNKDNILHRINLFVENCDGLIEKSKASKELIKKIDELSRRQPNKAMSTLAKLEQQFSMVTEHNLFKNIIPTWNRGLTTEYDQHVIKIEKEPTIIGKAKLLNEIVAPYIDTIVISFSEMKEEFLNLKQKLENE